MMYVSLSENFYKDINRIATALETIAKTFEIPEPLKLPPLVDQINEYAQEWLCKDCTKHHEERKWISKEESLDAIAKQKGILG